MTDHLDVLKFVEQHGIVLASAKGPVPSLAEAIAGGPIRGSWWVHKKRGAIFDAINAVADSSDVLCFRLVDRKLTFVHRRLWPALIRLADELGRDRLAAIKQEHTNTGAHRNVSTPYPKWVPLKIQTAAKALSTAQARSQLGVWLAPSKPKALPRRRGRLGGHAAHGHRAEPV
jgi:hypothetical protein